LNWDRLPRGHQRKKEAQEQHALPVPVASERGRQRNHHESQRGGEGKPGQLKAVGAQISQCQLHHRSSFIRRKTSSRSVGESLASLTRCSSSGRDAPSNTRSTNSRTIDRMTARSGLVGRYWKARSCVSFFK